jgi:rod shape-determining protein MreB
MLSLSVHNKRGVSILLSLFKKILADDLLIELSENLVSIKSLSSKTSFELEPYIALEKSTKGDIIKAIGSEAKHLSSSKIKVLNPFKHSRSFVGNFVAAEKILRHGVLSMSDSKIKFSPRVVIHQLEKTEGGLTDIEEKVLRELALGAGASEVVLYIGQKININIDSFETIKMSALNVG